MSVLLPNYSTCTTINNTLELDNNTTSHQEEITNDNLADIGTNEGDLGESFTDTSRESQEKVESNNQTETESNQPNTNTHLMVTRSKTEMYKPKQPYIGLTKVREYDKESGNVKEALIKLQWKETMDA
ncbi:hypothetical protein V8G54_020024 [Vigna mungo]|uniref:Uncharacterized protein n=1 Tax=Vigna mungo TaxID=3915 RepID=A0AAQ3RVI6_VIGMU